MIFLMVSTFIFLWFPLQFLTVYRFYNEEIAYSKYFADLFFICHIIAVSRSFVNPFIYMITNSNYGNGFRYFMHCQCFHKNDNSDSLAQIRQSKTTEESQFSPAKARI